MDILENRLTSVRIQASFILKWERVWLFVANFLGQESFVPAPVQVRSVHDVPVNLQQTSVVLFYNFLSLYEWRSVMPLKIRALRMDYSVYLKL